MPDKSYEAGFRRGKQLAESIEAHAKAAEPRVYEFEPYVVGIHDGFNASIAPSTPKEVT
jgi:hypothetical protein